MGCVWQARGMLDLAVLLLLSFTFGPWVLGVCCRPSAQVASRSHDQTESSGLIVFQRRHRGRAKQYPLDLHSERTYLGVRGRQTIKTKMCTPEVFGMSA
jgi:hypothetical protein